VLEREELIAISAGGGGTYRCQSWRGRSLPLSELEGRSLPLSVLEGEELTAVRAGGGGAYRCQCWKSIPLSVLEGTYRCQVAGDFYQLFGADLT